MLAFLVVVGVTFIYFYPHWAAVDVAQWLEKLLLVPQLAMSGAPDLTNRCCQSYISSP